MLKKHIKTMTASILILIMMIGASVSVFAFADDESVGNIYRDAVAAAAENGIINGFPDGTYRPQGLLTREEGAKITAALILGKEIDQLQSSDTNPFDDVENSRWSAPYIMWCVKKGILLGYGDGTFGPEDTLTGTQFAKMLLCALGLSREGNYVGLAADWENAVIEDGIAVKLFTGDAAMALNSQMTREQAALMICNAMSASKQRGNLHFELPEWKEMSDLTEASPRLDDPIIIIPVVPRLEPEKSVPDIGDDG